MCGLWDMCKSVSNIGLQEEGTSSIEIGPEVSDKLHLTYVVVSVRLEWTAISPAQELCGWV
jgi:hypothetical protein